MSRATAVVEGTVARPVVQSVRPLRQLLIALAAALVLVLVGLAYEPARHATLIWDDHVLAKSNAAFRHVPLSTLITQGFWPDDAFGDARAPYYRPLVLLSLRADVTLGGTAEDFHFTNILLHLFACGLLAFTARRLGARSGAGVIAALLWGLAPRLTESVAWIAGRTDVLAGLLGLAALALSPDIGAPASFRSFSARPEHASTRVPVLASSISVVVRSVASGVCLFGALLGKEVAVAFAAALAVAAGAKLARRATDARTSLTAATIRVTLTILGPVAIWLVLRASAIATKKAPEQVFGAARRAGTVLEAVERYAEMIVDATRPQTSIGMSGEPDTARAIIGGLVVVGTIAFAVRVGRRLPVGARVALTLAVVALLPVLHLVPIALAGSVAADRLLYVPLMGLALAFAVLASGCSLGTRARLLVGAVAIGLTCVSFVATHRRAVDYTDEARFWVNAAERAHPHNVTARNALALVVQDAGAVNLSCRLYERSAEVLARSPFAWLPPHKRTLESLVNCWARDGRYEDAVRLAEDLSRRYPTSGRVQMGLGFARLHLRDFDGATSAFTQGMTLDKGVARIATPILASMMRTRAEWDRFADPSARTPTLTDRKAWAQHLANVGRAKEADAEFVAVALDPSSTPEIAQPAISFLMFDGSIEAAERVVGRASPDVRRQAFLELVRARQAKRARVQALLERMERLTHE